MAIHGKPNEYKLLRRYANTTDDDDWAGLQTFPTAYVDVGSEAFGAPHKVEFCLRWIDDAGADSVDLTDAGSATCRVVRQMQYVPTATAGPSTQGVLEKIVVQSASFTVNAFIPFIVDEVMPGDRIGLRLTSMTPSAGAEYAEVFYRFLV